MDALGIDGVGVSFDGVPAVDGVTLGVAPGEVLGILGPSGSGKSTLLRAVAGLERLGSGSVSWHGDDITALAVHRRGFALMFQDGQLFPHRTVAQNIAYPLRITRASGQAERVVDLLDLVGLPGFGERRVTELSGGEQQRVALARSLAGKPRLLLLDEPLSSLDRELRERLAGDLRRILVATGTTAVFVTHDQDEAFAVSDRVAVMMRGRLEQVGTPAEVWRRPVNAAVARFLGYTTVLDPDRARLVVPEATGAIALRAAAVVVTDDASVRGTLVSSTPAVDGARVRVLLDGIGEVDGVAGPRHPLVVGSAVGVRFDPAGIAVLP
ncbi:thiamine transport system ATP-binding protein [Conyzicola lurida]|uniref:ABC-type quaternary amine transporter n=1 Tax=Conyzicola lurida TaxID=1172621 RepID=A0A841AMU5_9MICO|nr:ABC transporter ATP-binding protein [Conyzicola lurida]MBB5843654.1 thiamine transport system ATP-binding protein [Conyzicola lurida]